MRGVAIITIGILIAAIIRASSKLSDNFDCQLADCGCGPWGYCADCRTTALKNQVIDHEKGVA